METSLGLDWHLQDRLMISAEGFFKRYSRMPLSLRDDIPLVIFVDLEVLERAFLEAVVNQAE